VGGETGFLTQGFTKLVLYCLSLTSSPFCSGYFEYGGLENGFSRLASNYELSLSSSWDYRLGPQVPCWEGNSFEGKNSAGSEVAFFFF
jgi:hypothetical protein